MTIANRSKKKSTAKAKISVDSSLKKIGALSPNKANTQISIASKPSPQVDWAYFPRSAKPTGLAIDVVDTFNVAHSKIDSSIRQLSSDQVLKHVESGLQALGFLVETGKAAAQKINVPVLYGNNGRISKSFDADAHHDDERFVVEVEAGRAVTNNQFLKDLFEACMMDDVDYLAIAVRKIYGKSSTKDFDIVVKHFDTFFNSDRMRLPLKGILIIGY